MIDRRSDVATTFTREQVESLPLLNRNFTTLELLTPGRCHHWAGPAVSAAAQLQRPGSEAVPEW